MSATSAGMTGKLKGHACGMGRQVAIYEKANG
jgi:hypothetical protein